MKKEKEKRKKEENYIEKGEKGLKNASFWVNKLPPAGKKLISKEGGRNDQIAQYISLPEQHFLLQACFPQSRILLHLTSQVNCRVH